MDASAEIPPNPKVEAIIANISQLMDEAEQMLNDSTGHHAEQELSLLHTQCDTVRARLATCCSSAGRAIADGARQTDRVIRANPYPALAVALGAGLVAGALMSRRSD